MAIETTVKQVTTIKQILTEAKSKISNFENWTTKTSVRKSSGEWASPLNPNACSWCALGAIELATGGCDLSYRQAVGKLASRVPDDSSEFSPGAIVAAFNDFVGNPTVEHHAKLLACFDAAIASVT